MKYILIWIIIGTVSFILNCKKNKVSYGFGGLGFFIFMVMLMPWSLVYLLQRKVRNDRS